MRRLVVKMEEVRRSAKGADSGVGGDAESRVGGGCNVVASDDDDAEVPGGLSSSRFREEGCACSVVASDAEVPGGFWSSSFGEEGSGARNVAASDDDDAEVPGGFSVPKLGVEGGVSCSAGIHCLAIFFSTNTTRRMMSKTINPKAM